MSTKILLADDHAIIRVGIKALVTEHIYPCIIDEAGDEYEIREKMTNTTYDIMLLDIHMPGTNFIGLMEHLRKTAPATRIIVFTMHPTEIYEPRCLQLGAKAFLRKTASDADILQAFRKVMKDDSRNGKQLLPDSRKSSPAQEKSNNLLSCLSRREKEIALLMLKNHSLQEISAMLNIKYFTTHTYKRRIFEKLNVPDVVSLVQLMQLYQVDR